MTEVGQRFHIESSECSSVSTISSYENDNEDEDDVIERTLGEIVKNYGSTDQINPNIMVSAKSPHIQTIRFQVIIWNIGKLDVATGSVPMLFRISMFWNDIPIRNNDIHRSLNGQSNHSAGSAKKKKHKKRTVSYTLQGRNKALPNPNRHHNHHQDSSNMNEDPTEAAVDIPTLSILNVASFTIIGSPELELLDAAPEKRLFRWTCMYRATVMQEHLRVDQFPHDLHSIKLNLAILTNRRAGQRWDRRFWKLGLATEEDVSSSRKSLRVPYGLVVDHVRIPEFLHTSQLQFTFSSQLDGSFDQRKSCCAIPDVTLQVQLMVLRESGYYDRNIVPLLVLLNVVAATLTFVLDAEKLFFRGLLILNIAFNQMGVRLSVDKNLPSVGYEIRLQQILNHFFFVLLALILESAVAYELMNHGMDQVAWYLDAASSFSALAYNCYMATAYYTSRNQARRQYYSRGGGGEEANKPTNQQTATLLQTV